MTKTCAKYQEDISLFLDDEIEKSKIEDINKHLNLCSECYEYFNKCKKLDNNLKGIIEKNPSLINRLPKDVKKTIISHQNIGKGNVVIIGTENAKISSKVFLHHGSKYNIIRLGSIVFLLTITISIASLYRNNILTQNGKDNNEKVQHSVLTDIPTDWNQKIWKDCWSEKQELVDFTTPTWLNISYTQQRKYVKAYQEWYANRIKEPVHKIVTVKNTKFEMRLVPPGKFFMGFFGDNLANNKPETIKKNERQYIVSITKPFFLQITEVTQKQWQNIIGNSPWEEMAEANPSHFSKRYVQAHPDYPAIFISYRDIEDFLLKIQAELLQQNLSKEKSRLSFFLLTEAQWEYACRAGSNKKFYWGDSMQEIRQYANILGKEDGFEEIAPVGQLQPNNFGLYDMIGNVWEWTEDYYGDYPQQNSTDPVNIDKWSPYRVNRGGSWDDDKMEWFHCSYRGLSGPSQKTNSVGFRLALSIIIKDE